MRTHRRDSACVYTSIYIYIYIYIYILADKNEYEIFLQKCRKNREEPANGLFHRFVIVAS